MKALWALALAGCVSEGNINQTRPAGEDPLALLGTGADGIVDVDVAQVRGWGTSRRILEAAPALRERLAALPFDALEDVEAVWVALYGIGGNDARSLLLLRTDLMPARLAGDGAEVADYRGFQLWSGPNGASARVTPKLMAFGTVGEVRRSLDLSRGDGGSVRGDRALMEIWARCPSAKSGRPAVMAAFVLDDRLRDALRAQDLPGNEMTALAVSLAVGDGFDIGAIALLHGPAEAHTMADRAAKQVDELARKRTARILGLKPFLDPFVVREHDNEVHMAYRLPGTTVERLLARIEALGRAADRK